MRYKILLLLLFFSFSVGFIYAQENVDTLLQMLHDNKKGDTTRLLIWATLAKEYAKGDLNKSLSASDTVIRISKNIKLPGWEANAYNAKGAVYYYMGDFPRALQSFQKARGLAEQIGNQRRIAQSIGNIAAMYVAMGDYPKALESFQNQVDVATKSTQKDLIADGYGNLAAVYVEMANYTPALEFAQKALRINEAIKDTENIRNSYQVLGNIYSALNDYSKAIDYCKKSLLIDDETKDKRAKEEDLNTLAAILESSNNYSQAIIYRKEAIQIAEEMGREAELMNILVALQYDYAKVSDFSNAFDYTLKTQKLSEKFTDTITKGLRLINLGYVYSHAPGSLFAEKGLDSSLRYKQSLEFLNKGLEIAIATKKLDFQRNAWEYISIVYKKEGNYTKALEAYQNFINLRDSIINADKNKQITRLEIQYEFDKKKDSLDLQQKITDEKLKQQVLVAKQQQQELELRKRALDLTNKEKDIQKLAYLKSQADLQNEQLEKQQKEKQLTLSEKEKQLQQAKVKTLSQQQVLSKFKLQQQWFLSAGILVVLGLIASYFIYRNRLKQGRLKIELAKEKAEQEKKEAEFQRSLADVSLTALRSQMNPHFIFNCLNSIKLYTTQNDTGAASEYLTKFSKLIRVVMENSRSDRISLASELQALRLYIEMEAMRFKEKLKYSIRVEEGVESDYVEIPPLLLQPYVENAIWHGLMHKEEGGHIDISVSMQKNESLLEISITDDGIGRAKAAELKSKTATRHKSYGMKVTSERIALINQIYKTGANVVIHDLVDNEGEPAGTEVIIQIPV